MKKLLIAFEGENLVEKLKKTGKYIVYDKAISFQEGVLRYLSQNVVDVIITKDDIAGDMTKETEKKIMKTGIGKTDILKVAHHGSKTSSMKEFISKLSPDMAIISCGINNRYGHPDSETLEVLKDTGCNVFETDLSGQISIFYNKKTWVIKTKIK